MPTATHPPCCFRRLAKLRFSHLLAALALAVAGPATASSWLSAAESEVRPVGPTSREQPRPTDSARTRSDSIQSTFQSTLEPALRVAAKWRTNITLLKENLQAQQPEVSQEIPQQLPAPPEEEPAPVSTPPEPELLVETLPVERPHRDACFLAQPLSTVGVNIALPEGNIPNDVAVQCAATTPAMFDARLAEGWAITEQHWSATGLRHRPLYFEEINAERYGYTPSYALQPLISAVRFSASTLALPYKMVVDPPRSCVYTLGQYRPGSCAPRRWHRLPLKVGAGVFEAVVVVGLVALVP